MSGTETDPAAIASRSDDVMARVLGADLQSATLRMMIYLAVVAAVVATASLLA